MGTVLFTAQGSPFVVDDELAGGIATYRWNESRGGYIYRNRQIPGTRQFKRISLHRLVLPAPADLVVDHIDRDKRNNRRANLRIVTRKASAWNRGAVGGVSRFKGVAWNASSQKWQVMLQGHYIGVFANEVEAARAWVSAAEALYGTVATAIERAIVEQAEEENS